MPLGTNKWDIETYRNKVEKTTLFSVHSKILYPYSREQKHVSFSNISWIVICNTPKTWYVFVFTGEQTELVTEAIYSKPSDLKESASNNLMTSSSYNYVWSSSLDNNYSPPPRPPSMRLKAHYIYWDNKLLASLL